MAMKRFLAASWGPSAADMGKEDDASERSPSPLSSSKGEEEENEKEAEEAEEHRQTQQGDAPDADVGGVQEASGWLALADEVARAECEEQEDVEEGEDAEVGASQTVASNQEGDHAELAWYSIAAGNEEDSGAASSSGRPSPPWRQPQPPIPAPTKRPNPAAEAEPPNRRARPESTTATAHVVSRGVGPPVRSGKFGSEREIGRSGGSHRHWYAGYYFAKGKGKDAVRAYIDRHGPPPGRGGPGFHGIVGFAKGDRPSKGFSAKGRGRK